MMIALPAQFMFVEDTEPKRSLTKLPTCGSWGVCSDMENAGEVGVECNNTAVLVMSGYVMEWSVITGYMDLEGDACMPKERVEARWRRSQARRQSHVEGNVHVPEGYGRDERCKQDEVAVW